jgi:hypothetical protein
VHRVDDHRSRMRVKECVQRLSSLSPGALHANFDPELVQVMRHALDETMKKVPLEYADQGVSRRVHSQGCRARSDELRCASGGGRRSDPDRADPLQLNFYCVHKTAHLPP